MVSSASSLSTSILLQTSCCTMWWFSSAAAAAFFFFFSSLLVMHVQAIPTIAPTAQISSSTACNSSTDPKLCVSVLSPLPSHSTQYAYAGYSVGKSLEQAKQSASMMTQQLNSYGRRDSLLLDARGAIRVCTELNEFNVESLENVYSDLQADESTLTWEIADRVMTLMSAVLTNQETCMDELNGYAYESKLTELNERVHNGTRLYSVTLGLVANALEGKATAPVFENAGCRENATTESFVEAITGGIPENHSVIVSQNGYGNFTSIGEAINSAPSLRTSSGPRFVIYVREGTYYENVVVPSHKRNLVLIGDGINRTNVTGNRSTADGLRTFKTATFAVNGEGFIAMNMTFENTAGREKHQAVAVRNSANLSIFYQCSFVGYQDTLYVQRLKQFYRDCDVYGTVDFIFGNAAAVFQNCNIYPRKPLPGQKNTITAQGRKSLNSRPTGISIHNCTIRAALDLEHDLNSTKTYLGRPWREYSTTVYMQSYLDEFIDPAGWLEWDGDFALKTLYYGEFENYGPGSNTSRRVSWKGYRLMSVTQALNFTVQNLTTASLWLYNTSVPCTPGLL